MIRQHYSMISPAPSYVQFAKHYNCSEKTIKRILTGSERPARRKSIRTTVKEQKYEALQSLAFPIS